MNTILTEAFAESNSGAGAAGSSPLLHSDQVIVNFVLLPQPVPLCLMFGKHQLLRFERRADIDGEVRQNRLAASADEFDRVEIVEVRNGWERPGTSRGAVIRDRRCETCVSDKLAGGLVITKIVIGRRRKNDIRLKLAKELCHLPAGGIVTENSEIFEPCTNVVGSDSEAAAAASALRRSDNSSGSYSPDPQSPAVMVTIVT